jgi:hypothetical protein
MKPVQTGQIAYYLNRTPLLVTDTLFVDLSTFLKTPGIAADWLVSSTFFSGAERSILAAFLRIADPD